MCFLYGRTGIECVRVYHSRRIPTRRGARRRDPFGLFGRTYPRFSVARATTFTRGYERETAYTCVRLRRNTVAQFARLRHGRLVNSAARNQTPHTPSSRSCIPISPVGLSMPRAISLLEIAGWRIRARRFSRDSFLEFLSFFANNFKCPLMLDAENSGNYDRFCAADLFLR